MGGTGPLGDKPPGLLDGLGRVFHGDVGAYLQSHTFILVEEFDLVKNFESLPVLFLGDKQSPFGF